MVTEISSGLVVRNKKVLMTQDSKTQKWNFPSADGRSDELSADTAQRAVQTLTECDTQVSRYRDRLKTRFDQDEKEVTWQPYSIEIEGTPEHGEWVPVDQLESKDLVQPLEEMKDKLSDRL
ncbi:hypothetical protein [Candidatus Nanohalobium constans]|uniref:Nudix hydrolase domain-containing protein n=1 Tax=Candidatus Nanohalobium constans TaxID=2565781 RepID=A0A5Q0UGI6_9ARCH|nr:hypothetical protein [Candidatus Nanohalobium constans]QGA80491.1 hypothetical protein LC1Nh_0597 [Candidatus Nanohalobium constans]